MLSYFSPNCFSIENIDKSVNNLLNKVDQAEPSADTLSNKQTAWNVIINPIPAKTKGEAYLPLAKAALVQDFNSGEYLLENNVDSRLPIASLTKLMTAYVVLKETSASQIFVVPDVSTQPGDSLTGLQVGEKLTVESLLKGLLITSGSDSALTLAVGIAGSQKTFIDKMNLAASELQLTNSHFANPVGWDDVNNYSSAKDLTILSNVLLRNENFRKIVSTKYSSILTQNGRRIPLSNTNLLLGSNGYIGLKTGYTPAAGECLIALNSTNNHEVLSIVIGSPDRFGQTSSLLSWINSSFLW